MSAKQSSNSSDNNSGQCAVPTKNNPSKSNNSSNNKNANKKANKKSFKSKANKIKNNSNNTTTNSNTNNKNNIANIGANNNSSNNNNNGNEQNANDEIIEEFDFSDSDLAELSACGNENTLVAVALRPPIDTGVEAKETENVKPQMQNTDDDDAVAVYEIEQVVVKKPQTPTENPPTEGQSNDKNGKQNEDIAANYKNTLESEGCQDIVNEAATDNEKSKQTTDSITINSVDDKKRSCNNESNDNDNDNDNECANEPYDDDLLVQILDQTNNIAEARLAARRQARAEAREIRMRELERQQKEQEVSADRVFDMHTTASGIDPLSRTRLGLGSASPAISGLLNTSRGSNSMSSRRSSEDSLEEEGRSLRDIRHELKDVEERFRKAMIANAQLDNERASQTYQIQLLKDKLEDMEETYAQLQREFKEKSRDCNALKRSLDKLSEELKLVQGQLNERDTLITEQGLVIVAIENEDGTDAKRALVTVENAQLLGSVQGSLDVRLKKFTEEKQQLQAEVQQLQEQLETYKSQGKGRGRGNSLNGPLGSDDDEYEAQREANKIISDYKYKLQKAEQEIASLQSSLARSETQVIRYKSTAEAAEKAESELKIERRKLQRENREAMEKLEELETSNNHLIKRLDKLKNAKSALLKDL